MAQMPLPLFLLIIQCKVKCSLTEREHSFTLPSMDIINKQSFELINAFQLPYNNAINLLPGPQQYRNKFFILGKQIM